MTLPAHAAAPPLKLNYEALLTAARELLVGAQNTR